MATATSMGIPTDTKTINTNIIIEIPSLELRVIEEIIGKDDAYFENEDWKVSEALKDLNFDLNDLRHDWKYDSKYFEHNGQTLMFSVQLIEYDMYSQAILYQFIDNELVELSYTEVEYEMFSGKWLIELDEDIFEFQVKEKQNAVA